MSHLSSLAISNSLNSNGRSQKDFDLKVSAAELDVVFEDVVVKILHGDFAPTVLGDEEANSEDDFEMP